jgi:hypothetical protein
MKIETITVMQRKNLGNYEHIEISASAKVEEGEEALTAMLSLKTFVETALTAKTEEIKAPVQEVKPEPVVEAPKKEKKSKKSTYKFVESTSETPVSDETSNIPAIPEEKPAKPAVPYNSAIAEHKSIFGGYLTKKYENSWKTSHPADEIKSFTASLNGKDFLDNDGKIVESFLNLVHGFFGA